MAENTFNTVQEIWKAIPGFPGYEVSDHGNVRSFWKRGYHVLKSTPHPLTLTITNPGGYPKVCFGHEAKTFRVHRLVLDTFLGQRPKGFECCHKDGNPLNNRLNNLYWGTSKNNAEDSIHHKTMPRGEKHGMSKLTPKDIIEIRRRFPMERNQSSLAREFNVTRRAIGMIVNRINWKHIP